jgi:hypothetical protein
MQPTKAWTFTAAKDASTSFTNAHLFTGVLPRKEKAGAMSKWCLPTVWTPDLPFPVPGETE